MGNTGFTINSNAYNFLKWIALTVLPALAALMITLGLTLNWAEAPSIAGIISAVDTFLGVLLGKSSSNYQKQNPDPLPLGDLVVMQNKDGTPAGMRIVGTHENPVFEDGGKVSLDVRREPSGE
jgi:hypothetical protein